ncbi:MAG TPA: FMN-binding protein [Tissierellaceae bacterium]|nr:FMN-binding protein [Tissierellaceae bacterium]
MRRKILALILVFSLMTIIFTGCTSENAPVDEGTVGMGDDKGNLVDGTYLIKDPVSDHGNYPMATMEVSGGEIESFEYNEYLADSGEVKSPDNYPYEDGINVMKDLNAQFNEKKDINAVDFDAVSGATQTKGYFKDMAEKLIDKAKKGETYTPIYKDGIYEAKAEEDSHGWLPEVIVVVKSGQIVGVNYQELAIEASEGVEKGDAKSADNYDYEVPFEVSEAIQKLVIDNNGIKDLEVDGITGATSTRTTMLELVEKALSTAK